jgi:2,3-bisphosphoglycerate-independent phosphoglycerate mutase
LLIVIDGLADRPVRALGGRTPLQAASTPALDQLAAEGRCGLADPVAPGVVPDTAAGSLALFGQSPLALKGGPVEAMGAGFRFSRRDNFATLDGSGNVIDRRAGRIREETSTLAAALDRLPLPGSLADEIEVRVRSGTEHRFALVLRGEGLSSAIQGSDPGDGAAVGPPLTPSPVDPTDPKAVHTARVLALFEREARGVLAKHPLNRTRQARGEPPANAVLTRGAGRIHRLVPLEEAGFPLRITCIAGDHTILGLASWLGAETITSPKMTANLDTELEAKFEASRGALKRSDLVVLHLKGADIASHDQRPDLKVAFLEQIDLHLQQLLDQHSGDLRVAVASDHATLSESGQHAADPLPVLIWERETSGDKVKRFDEHSVGGGELQRFPLQMLLGMLFNLR